MFRKRNTILFGVLFIFVFSYLGKNSNLKGTKRFFISLKIVWLLIFGVLDSVNATDSTIIPGAHGFKPSISRPSRNNPGSNNQSLGRSSPNPGKGVRSGANKIPRASSGFYRMPHNPVEKKGLYGGATGLGGSDNGSGSGSPDSNPNNLPFNRESSDQCQNPNYLNQKRKKKKKHKFEGVDFQVEIEYDLQGNPIYTVNTKEGSKKVVSYDQSLDKYYHADVYGLQFPDGFNKNHAQNLNPNISKEMSLVIKFLNSKERILDRLPLMISLQPLGLWDIEKSLELY